ncbi:unnamed protein product [Protopolystoma xenopodis]|uniref:MRH domain-containing protein n=1 Tax=Protopolystoma xenopodis TaxID=117903 RepID=A0A448WD98_9PLAT|nr:unnamed protein product [Protopolystoma xenopodis]
MTQNQLQESTNTSAGIQTDQASFESMPQIDLPPPPMAPPSEPKSQESINLNQTLEEKEIRDHEVSEQLEPQELPQTPSPRTMPVDYGPKYAFSMLVEPDVGCLTFDELDYTYRLCPFDRAFQAPRGSTSGGTLLGQWAGWLGKGHPKPGTIADVDEARGETIDKQKHDASDDSSTSDSTDEAGEFEKKIDQSSERKLERTWKTDQEEDENEEEVEEKKRDRVYDIMLYENGVQCWNGPARSVKVYVHCGSKNEITSISESSRCLYDFHLSTPAACHLPAEKALAAKYPEMVWDDLPVHTEL